MNNEILEITNKNFAAATEMAKKAVEINMTGLDKLIDLQFSAAKKWLYSSVNQSKAFAKINSVDDLTTVSTTMFQSLVKQSQDQAQEISNLATQSRDAYLDLFVTAKSELSPATKAPRSTKPTLVKAAAKPQTKKSA